MTGRFGGCFSLSSTNLPAFYVAAEVPSSVASSTASAQPSFIGFAMTAVSKRRKKSPEPIDSGQLLLFAA
jgi:hypothetical protein